MDGPITCEQLRNIHKIYEDVEMKKCVNNMIDSTKQTVINYAYSQNNRHICVRQAVDVTMKYKLKVEFQQVCNSQKRSQCYHLFDRSVMFNEFMNGLQTVFPDMKITPDPLKTYLLLDWS